MPTSKLYAVGIDKPSDWSLRTLPQEGRRFCTIDPTWLSVVSRDLKISAVFMPQYLLILYLVLLSIFFVFVFSSKQAKLGTEVFGCIKVIAFLSCCFKEEIIIGLWALDRGAITGSFVHLTQSVKKADLGAKDLMVLSKYNKCHGRWYNSQ